ncbi:MAG: TetR family transcriptional regulator C-terminal domain-containing protein, partial [Steroidobacteraceae bacterium]
PAAGGRSRRSRQRQRLIDACIAALHLYGPSRTTVEKVVAIADLSPGIVRFYFDSKDAMLVASLAYLAAEFEERVLVPVARLKDSPVRALRLLVDLYFDLEIASTRKISVWYSFWGEASSRQEYLDICGKKDEDFATLVRELIERLIEESGARHLDADGLSLGLIGVLEVLWQGFAFQSEDNIDRAAARERSLAYLRSVFPGSFPRGGASRSPTERPASVPSGSAASIAAATVSTAALPAWVYTSAALFALEREHLLRPAWQVIGHTAELAATGDFLSACWPWERALLVRGSRGELHALRNACRRHPHALLQARQGRIAGNIRCAAHDLTYGLDGRRLEGATPGDLTALESSRVGPLLLVRTPQPRGAARFPEAADGPAEWPELLPKRVQEIAVAADWKVLIEQWLESGSPLRHFLPPNQLLDLSPEGPQLLQVVPEAPGRCRLVRFELRAGRGGKGRQPASRRAARPSLDQQVTLAESTQRGLESLPPQAEDDAAVPAALAQFRRSVATLLPLVTRPQGL